MPKNKTKGSKTERELFQKFIDDGRFRVARVAGSGTMENADCDLIAGTKFNKYGIEAKSSKKNIIYITKEQIDSFMIFCEIFKLKPAIALRFNREGWLFIKPHSLKDSGKHLCISIEEAKKKGKKFPQFFGSPGDKKEKKEKRKSMDDYELYLQSLEEEDEKNRNIY